MVNISIPYPLLPARISIQLQLLSSRKRVIWAYAPLSPGKRVSLAIPLAPSKRGEYSGHLSLLLSDPFTLFRGIVFIDKETTVFVLPSPTPPEETLRPQNILSDIASQKRENSEDLYEVRKYYPGDDPRKINWKMFSHSGELFLRMGESGTPKKRRIFTTILLDSKIPPLLQETYTDQLIKTFLGFLTLFQENGKEIFSILPGEKEWRKIDTLLAYTPSLAHRNLLQRDSHSSFPMPDGNEEFFILAPPDSSYLSPLLTKIDNKNHACHLFIKSYTPISLKTDFLWKRLFIKTNSLSFFPLLLQNILEKTYLKKLELPKNLEKRQEKTLSLRGGYVKKI